MSYAIVGFGKIGQALAHAFARKNIDVAVASRRPPEALAPQARGWRAGARTRRHLGSAHLPGFVQEGAVIDLRPRDWPEKYDSKTSD
jgi:predicted dinucleotide-binding enzyme